MPVMDEFREEREAMKQKSFKEKLLYFWDYYKWHVIGGAALIALATSLIYSIVTHKDFAFYGAFLNSYQAPGYETFREEFAERAGIDLQKYDVMLDTDMYITLNSYDQGTVNAAERLMVYIAAGDIDVMASDQTTMNRYAYNQTFKDLREFLPEELQDELSPYYYYIDGALASEIAQQQENGTLTDNPQYPADPTDIDNMKDPIPVGLYIQDCPRIQDAFLFQEDKVVLSVIGNVTETQDVLEFIRYVFGIDS